MVNNKVVYKTRVVFKVMDFAKHLDTDWMNKKTIDSNKFMIGSVDEWYCKIQWNFNYVCLYLILSDNNGLPIEIQYQIYIIDNNNQLFDKRLIEQKFFNNDYNLVTKFRKQQLMDNKDLLLMDNTLTIGLDITVYKRNNSHQNCGAKYLRFAQLFSMKEFSTCRLIVGNNDKKEFSVSKFALSLESEVFEKMFTTDCNEKNTNEVIIDDVDSNVFEQFLQYLSSGMCDKLDEMTDELLYIADKYMVSSLKTICLNLIFMRINTNNALKTLKLFQDFGADEVLMKKVNDFIGENMTSMIFKEYFEKLAIDSL
ncbi:uncharacterized protein LOC128962553 [Oppia nitens]|uniref:uncharacterized protein LOC128962553 n=1 Tax=Oppia nitens TaxID=1686743 RepID=UPI0023DA9DA5|nr:uncharacterized protein LOC128962553 [Oppia nitens]